MANKVNFPKNYTSFKNMIAPKRYNEIESFTTARDLIASLTHALRQSNKDIKQMYSHELATQGFSIMHNIKNAYKTKDKQSRIKILEEVIDTSKFIGDICDMLINEKFFTLKQGANIIKNLGFLEAQLEKWINGTKTQIENEEKII